MVWSKDYKRSIDCDSPKGFSQRAHCAARRKRSKGEETKSKSPFNEMHQVKSHKSVESIAKKHRLEVSFVKKQLEMGIPIEHEHTKDKDLATDIALQHLDEIPDYYTRLKRMESDAKKHHKKFKDVKEALDGKTPRDPDYSLKDWFKGWVQTGGKYDGKPCARQPGQTTKPYCRDADVRASMSKDERNKRAAKKRKEDPNPDRSGDAKIVTQEEYIQEKKGEKDACYHKVKSRYKIWPSAYASGALVKCREVGASNWGTKSEDVGDSSLADLDSPVHMPPIHGVHVDYEKRYCSKCQKEELRSECKYGPKYWDIYSIPTKLKDMVKTEEKDHEYSMARSELSTIDNAVKRLRKRLKGEGNIEAWVQSKITKAADYIDTAADYMESGEHDVDEGVSFDVTHTSADVRKSQRAKKIANLAQRGVGGEKSTAARMSGVSLPSIKKEEKLVDKIVDEMKCWPGYKKKGTQKLFGKKYNRCVKAEDVSLEDVNGNTFAEVVDLIKPEPIKGFKSQVDEATRMQAQTGNVIMVTLMWRGKYYSLKMFFPQVKLPTRQDINDELQKVYPGSKVVYHSVSEIQPGQPLIQVCGPQGGSSAKPGPNRNYVKPMGEEVEIDESVRLDKSKMKCNKPKAQAVGDSLTGKSHVVKACSGGEEKIIRFGQRGVKGSPKKKGESKAYAMRRHKFKTRHAENIAKGPMSAAYWANKVKW